MWMWTWEHVDNGHVDMWTCGYRQWTCGCENMWTWGHVYTWMWTMDMWMCNVHMWTGSNMLT